MVSRMSKEEDIEVLAAIVYMDHPLYAALMTSSAARMRERAKWLNNAQDGRRVKKFITDLVKSLTPFEMAMLGIWQN